MPLWRIIVTAVNLVGARFGGAALGLVTQVLLARLLAQQDVGVVFMAMSATSIISLLATLGYPSLALTSTARYLALGRANLLQAFKAVMARDTLVMSLALFVLAALAVAVLPLEPALRTAVVFGCLSTPASALLRINSVLANSQRRFMLSYVPDFLFRPGLLMLYLAGLWAAGVSFTATHVLWAYTAVNTLVALGQALLLGRQGILPGFQRLHRGLSSLLRMRAMALVVVFAVMAAFGDIVTLIGGLYLPAEDVAMLGVAIRLATLAGFVTQATQQLVLPDLAFVMARKPRAEVNRLLLRVNLLTLAASFACVVGAIVAGPLLLGIFGKHYVAGQWPLVLFMVSQAIRAASGLNQYLLAIGGHQARTAGACVFAVAVLLAAAGLLAPRYGVTGLGFAAVLADAVWAGLLALQARRFAGYRGDILGLLRAR
jgi:O-antigen/teichoic acid export membrane protein